MLAEFKLVCEIISVPVTADAALIWPAVRMLPPVTLPVAEIVTAVIKLPTMILLPVMLPVAVINPAVIKLPPVMLATALSPTLETMALDELLYRKVTYGAPCGPSSMPPPLT